MNWRDDVRTFEGCQIIEDVTMDWRDPILYIKDDCFSHGYLVCGDTNYFKERIKAFDSMKKGFEELWRKYFEVCGVIDA